MSETIGVQLESDLCTGCGNCWFVAPDVFEEDRRYGLLSRVITTGRVTLADNVVIIPEELNASAIAAAEACPGEIINIYDIS